MLHCEVTQASWRSLQGPNAYPWTGHTAWKITKHLSEVVQLLVLIFLNPGVLNDFQLYSTYLPRSQLPLVDCTDCTVQNHRLLLLGLNPEREWETQVWHTERWDEIRKGKGKQYVKVRQKEQRSDWARVKRKKIRAEMERETGECASCHCKSRKRREISYTNKSRINKTNTLHFKKRNETLKQW